MKQIYSSLFFTLISITSFSQNFDWETATENTNNITQTVSSITATVTTSDNTLTLVDAGGYKGSTGFIIFDNDGASESLTVTFDSNVNIISLYGFTAEDSIGADWIFTPTGGSNSSVSQSIPNTEGVTVDLNWDDITSFTITNQGGGTFASFAIDNIILDSTTLSINDFRTKNDVKIYPNPSSQFIQISNLNSNVPYTIFSILGNEIKKGIISNNKQIDIRNFTNGLYLLKFDNGNIIKFIKK